jgi:hypothetical protein
MRLLNVKTGSIKAKVLASSFIPKFIKYFQNKIKEALDVQLDLVEEEEDIQIRTTAIKGLHQICQDLPEEVGSIASVLSQLIVSEEEKRVLDVVKNTFLKVLKIDTKSIFLFFIFSFFIFIIFIKI